MPAQANGLLSRDGNPHTLTGALVEFPSFSDTLQDVRTSNDTRATIDNNAAAISALAGLNEASGSWDQCLQVGTRLEIIVFRNIASAAHGSHVAPASSLHWPGYSVPAVHRRHMVRVAGPVQQRGTFACLLCALRPPASCITMVWGRAPRTGWCLQGFGVLTHDKAVCDAAQL